MSDLVGNPKDRFSQNEAHLFLVLRITGLCAVKDVLKPPGSFLATDPSKAVVLV